MVVLLLIGAGELAAQSESPAPYRLIREHSDRDLGRPQDFGVSGAITFVLYSGDIDSKASLPGAEELWRVSGEGVVVWRALRFGTLLSLHARGTVGYYPMRARSSVYDFVNRATAASLAVQMEFFPYSPLRPYLFAGAGAMQFGLRTYIKAEGLFTPGGARQGTSTSTTILPLGGGLVWFSGDRFDAYYQFSKTLTLSDNLDGWESNIRDNLQVLSVGLILYF